MTSDPNIATSKPPPGVPGNRADAEARPALAPPVARGGLPGQWGRWLPVLMLVAGAVGLALLIGTGPDKRKHTAKPTQTPAAPAASPVPSQTTQDQQDATAPADQAPDSSLSGDMLVAATIMAAVQAFEACAANHEGSYAVCDLAQLEQLSPELASDATKTNLTITSTDATYLVKATSPDQDVFTLDHKADGNVARTCTKPGTGSCAADGTW